MTLRKAIAQVRAKARKCGHGELHKAEWPDKIRFTCWNCRSTVWIYTPSSDKQSDTVDFPAEASMWGECYR